MLHTYSFILVLSLTSSLVWAQKNYRFTPLEEGGGLPNSRCVSVLQDEESYMWFATHSGIEKFNGTDMKHYPLNAFGLTSDNDDIINIAVKTADNAILCGNESGSLYKYNRQDDCFNLLLHNTESDLLFNIYALYQDGDNVWIGNSGGLLCYNIKDKKLHRIKAVKSTVQALVSYDLAHLLVASDEGLFLLNTHSIEVKKVLSEPQLTTLFVQNKGRVLLGTSNSRLLDVVIENKQVTVRKTAILGNGKGPVKRITVSPEGFIAAGVDGQGVFMLNDLLEEEEHYVFNKDDVHSLVSDGVYDIFYAKDNTFWVATWGAGVCFHDPNQKPFEIVRHVPYMDNSLSNNTVSSIAQSINNIWYGTKEGISIYNTQSQNWTHLPTKNSKLGKGFITLSLFTDRQGAVWAATYGKGLLKYAPDGRLLEVFDKTRPDLYQTASNHLFCTIQCEDGRIWSAGIWGDISIFDFEKKQRSHVNLTNVRTLFEADNEVYVGTLSGLFIIDKKNHTVRRTSHHLLNSSRIITINKHPEKEHYYFGTDANGLLLWDSEKDSLHRLRKEDGLPSNFVRSLLPVGNNDLWIGTTGGLAHLNVNSNEIESYLKEDGLASKEFSENAAIMGRDGRAYFGGINGVSVFMPEEITKSASTSVPILTGIKVLGKELKVDSSGVLKQNINLQKGMVLPYKKNSFTIEYGAIAYTNPHKVLFQWRLAGLNDVWTRPGNVREANFTSIPPGKYTFELRASNEDGIWQDDVLRVFDIQILKPLWLSAWAILFYILITGVVVYLLFKYVNTLLHDRHSMEKQQFFISIAHDLRTPLSLIKLPVEKMMEKNETLDENKKSLRNVKRNVDRLTNLVNQLLDFQKADLKKMTLRIERINLSTFIEDRVQAFLPFAEEKNIDLTTTLGLDEVFACLDKDKMDKIMYNLLSNALKYNIKGGRVDVSLKETGKHCIISVSDTGEGIPHNHQSHIFKRYYRADNAINSREVGSGVGLMLTKQLVELQKGHIKFTSLSGKGSTFTVTLPRHFNATSNEDKLVPGESEENIVPILPEGSAIKENGENGVKILIVEDNPELRQTLLEEFAENYRVFGAADGEEGVKMAKRHLPRLIISDVMMPHKNGHELCAELKDALETCHIPIILLTALDSPDYKREGLEYGADAYVEKPFEIKLLKAQVANLIKSREVLKKKYLLPSSTTTEQTEATEHPGEELLEKIKDYALGHLLDPKLSVETLAAEVGVSRPVLYRRVKSLTDLSPQQFLLIIRLNEAARLLRSGNANVSEAAYDAGFSDPKYFSQIFKKHFGVSPSQYVNLKVTSKN